RPDFRMAPFALLPFAAIALSFVSAQMQGNTLDEEFLMGGIKSFAVLLLLPWVRHYDMLRLTLVAGLVFSVVAVGLFVAACASDPVQLAIFVYVKAHNDMIMMTHRTFLGFRFFGMYYKSLISIVLAFSCLCYRWINDCGRKVRRTIAVGLMFSAFVVSGTRATILAPFLLIGLCVYLRLQQTRYTRYFCYPLLAVGFLLFLFLVFSLASESGEASNVIKYGHLTSYAALFAEHPEYILVGQGLGSSFYSVGFHGMAVQTEWTYFELLRTFGLFSLPILAVLLYPLKALWAWRRDSLVLCIMLAYCEYLLVAGTNPLLMSSTGMLVLLTIYSYISTYPASSGNVQSAH
ncbi:MAG: hypothetical protein J1F06_06550, partial [Prevotellaceae bacterium]|nr:hypothetical protein [Prevotellaceae bacterium]